MPLAMAFAEGSSSADMAVSGVGVSLRPRPRASPANSKDMALTDHDVGGSRLFLKKFGIVQISVDEADVRVLLQDRLALCLGADEQGIAVLRVGGVEVGERLAADIALRSC